MSSIIICIKLYCWHILETDLLVAGFNMLRLKSPKIIISGIPVSIANPIDRSMSLVTDGSELGVYKKYQLINVYG